MKKKTWDGKKIMHVYNRGVDKRQVFMDQLDVWRFTEALNFFNTVEKTEFFEFINPERGSIRNSKKLGGPTTQLVKIHAYCLCLNHFHLILEEVEENGVSLFMKKLGGYTRYFNQRHKRTGALFAGNYKRRLIETDADLQNVSAYVHKNYYVHDMTKRDVGRLVRSSYMELFDEKHFSSKLIQNAEETGGFKNLKQWQRYIDTTVQDIRGRRENLLKEEKQLFLE